MFEWRYIILACVSSDEQVKNGTGETKKSLDYQEETARIWGDKHGGTYIKTYRAEGFSRSGYYDFSEALATSGDFDELARDARAHKFDVILMESFDRLGDLAVMWFTYLEKKAGKPYIQIRSVQKPLIIEDPAEYDPRYDESTPDALNDAQKTNRYRINKLRRGGQVGIPERARMGKYSRRLPRGYTFTGTKKEYRVELDPIFKRQLIDAKNKYLAGWTLPALEAYTGWKRNAIKEMLRNPFYAGKTSIDRGVIKKQPGARRGHWEPKDEPVTFYDGLHEPCWDIDTYHKLAAEIKRRGKHLRHRRTYPLSGLVVCQQCDRHMHIDHHYYRCKGCELTIRENVVMDEFVNALRESMSVYQDDPVSQAIPPVDNSRAIAALKKQQDKVRVAYETTDSYTAEEYATRKREITKEIDSLQDVEVQQKIREQEHKQKRESIKFLGDILPMIETWIEIEPAGEANVQISQAVERVVISPDKTVNVVLW